MIIRASFENIHLVTPLFDLYRQFYKKPSDIKSAEKFLFNLVSTDDSVVFMYLDKDQAAGFVQLYPTYSSMSMKRAWILNDLYVLESHRGQGIAQALIHQAVDLARSSGASHLSLETAATNPAVKLYERLGWKLSSFSTYEFTI